MPRWQTGNRLTKQSIVGIVGVVKQAHYTLTIFKEVNLCGRGTKANR